MTSEALGSLNDLAPFENLSTLEGWPLNCMLVVKASGGFESWVLMRGVDEV